MELWLSDREFKRLDRPNSSGNTPLMVAVKEFRWSIVVALLEAGADPNVRSGKGVTPFYEAIPYAPWDVLDKMVSFGADTRVLVTGGRIPLTYALAVKRTMVVKNLVNRWGAHTDLGYPPILEIAIHSYFTHHDRHQDAYSNIKTILKAHCRWGIPIPELEHCIWKLTWGGEWKLVLLLRSLGKWVCARGSDGKCLPNQCFCTAEDKPRMLRYRYMYHFGRSLTQLLLQRVG